MRFCRFLDRTTVNLDLEATVSAEGQIWFPGPETFSLAPGETDVEVSTTDSLGFLTADVQLHAIYPHMHTLGKSMRVTRNAPGNLNQCVTDVYRWNFNWQQFFFFKDPITLTPQDTLKVSCTYDTTSRSTPTTCGDGTQDEMCYAVLYVSE